MATGGATIGALRVIIGADSAALTKGLKDATSSLSAFGARVDKIALGIAASFAAAGVALAVAVKGAINEADQLGKAAQKIGIGVEELSKLKFAADLADVSFETLSTSMARFNKNIVEVATGGVGPASQAFNAMGISVKNADGSLKTNSQLLSEVADKFATYEDGAAKSALAMALFGRAGAEMIPLLNEGAAGLQKAADEATRFGIVITTEAAQGAQNFNDNLTRLNAIARGFTIQFTAELVPALEQASTEFVSLAGNGDLAKAMAQATATVFAFLAKEIAIVTIKIQELIQWWGALRNLMAADVFVSGEVTKAWQALVKVGDDANAKIKAIGEAYERTRAAITAGGGMQKPAEDMKKLGDEAKKVPAPLLDTSNAIKSVGGAAKSAKTSLDEMAEAGKRTFEDTRLPAEKYAETVRKLNEQLAAGVINAETYARAVSKARNEMIKADPAAQIFENALSSALDRAIDGTGTLIEQLKALARDLAKAFASAAFKALLFGQTGGLGGTGLIGGLFGSNVAGLQHGGSFRVGGSGPADSQLVAFRATPGERVDVRTPGQQRDMSSPVNVSTPVRVVNAFDAVDFLSKALGEAGGEKVILNYVRANPSAFRAALS